MTMWWKRHLVGTGVGSTLQWARAKLETLRVAALSPEQSGTVAQDACAQLLVAKLCKPHGAFLDIGSHIGSVIAEVRRHDPSVRIIAFEAVPAKAEYLTRKFPSVAVHSCALGDRTGEVSFFVDHERPGYSSLAATGVGSRVSEIKVMLKRLDDMVPIDAQADLIKMDVEGAELGVLRGGAETVARHRPVIVFESGPDGGRALGFSCEAMYQWLSERSYEVLVPNRVAHEGPALSLDGFLESHFYPRRTTNYCAVPVERREEVRDRARKALGIVPGQ